MSPVSFDTAASIPNAARQFPALLQLGATASAAMESNPALEKSELRTAKNDFKDQVAIFLARSRTTKVNWQKFYASALIVSQRPEHLNCYIFLCLAAFGSEDKQPYLALAAALASFADFLAGEGATPFISSSLRADTTLAKLPQWLATELAKKIAQPAESDAWVECACAAARLTQVAHARLSQVAEAEAQKKEVAPAAAGSQDDPLDPDALDGLVRIIEQYRPAAITEPGPAASAEAGAAAGSESADPAEDKGVDPPPAASSPAQVRAESAAAASSSPPVAQPRAGAEEPIAMALRQMSSEPRNPLPYLFLRSALWLPITELAGPLPAPERAVRERFQSGLLLEAGNAQELLRESEHLFCTYPLWLELQLYTAMALESLQASAARDAVGHSVSLLLRRFPELLQKSLGDGTPVASEETKQWLEREQRRWLLESAPPLLSSRSEQSLRLALRRMQEQVSSARSGRDRFALRLETAQLCLERGRADLSAGLMTQLLTEAERYRLDEWEPLLLCRVLHIHSRVGASPVARIEQGERQRVRQLLCQLDLVAAEQLESP